MTHEIQVTLSLSERELKLLFEGNVDSAVFMNIVGKPVLAAVDEYMATLSPEPLRVGDNVMAAHEDYEYGVVEGIGPDWIVIRPNVANDPQLTRRYSSPEGLRVHRNGKLLYAPWPEAK